MGDYKKAPYEQVSELCDSDNHDLDLDTQQTSDFGQSCWARVQEAFGMMKVTAPSPVADLPPAQFVEPVFEYFDEPKVRAALVLDTSASMNLPSAINAGETRLQDLDWHARDFIDQLETGDVELGIVTFASVARVDQALTPLDDAKKVEASKDALPDNASGKTSIGLGMKAGYDMLTAAPQGLRVMVLITDGFHNHPLGDTSLEPLTVLEDLVAANIRVHTVGLGDSINEAELRKIADASGAMYWKASNTRKMEPVLPKIAAIIQGGSILGVARQQSLAPGQIHVTRGFAAAELGALLAEVGAPAGYVPLPEPTLAPIWVESGSEAVRFSLSWSDTAASLDLVMTSPAGRHFGKTTLAAPSEIQGARRIPDLRRVSYVFEGAQSGQWSPAVVGDPSRAGTYTLLATAINRTVTGYADAELSVDREGDPAIRILGTVRYGLPVTGASVTASVTDPGGAMTRVQMHDDGNPDHGDEVAADGLYSVMVEIGDSVGTYTADVVFDVDPNAVPSPTVIPGEEPQARGVNPALYPEMERFTRAFPVAGPVGSPTGPTDDLDGDGLRNQEERAGDADGDGLANNRDRDSDDDDLSDLDETDHDPDGDGEPSYLDRDSDGDGQDDSEDPDPLQPTSSTPDAVATGTWFTLYSHQTDGARFVTISEDGETLFVEASGRNLQTSTIERVARGTLDRAALDDLRGAIETLRELGSDALTAMRPVEPIEVRGLFADVSTTTDDVSAWRGLELAATPSQVAQTLERAAAEASRLTPHTPLAVVQATTVDAARVERIQSDPRRAYSFVPIDGNTLSTLPGIATALRDPGRLVELDATELPRVREWQDLSNLRARGSSVFVTVERSPLAGHYQLHLPAIVSR
jgi:uncharacterized protein YegL